jgi:hypothetical protein
LLISFDGSLTNLALLNAHGVPSFRFSEFFCNHLISWRLDAFEGKQSLQNARFIASFEARDAGNRSGTRMAEVIRTMDAPSTSASVIIE